MSRRVVPPVHSAELHAGCLAEGRSDVGRVRDENQDFMGVFRVPGRLLAVVADGMGGHSGGYEASRVAVDAMRQTLVAEPDARPPDVLARGVVAAHEAIRGIAAQSPEFEGMGTTVVAVLVEDGQAWFVHVGDSRAYVLRDGRLTLVTLDHSRVHRMLVAGMLTPDQVEGHPMGHILERSVGASDVIEPDVTDEPFALATGDRIVLCSDGVWGVLEEEHFAGACGIGALGVAADAGLGLALARNTDDNATLVCVEVVSGAATPSRLEDVRVKHGLMVARSPSGSETSQRQVPPVGVGEAMHDGGPVPTWVAVLAVALGVLLLFAFWPSGGGTEGGDASSPARAEQSQKTKKKSSKKSASRDEASRDRDDVEPKPSPSDAKPEKDAASEKEPSKKESAARVKGGKITTVEASPDK